VELANFAGDTVVEVADAAERGVHRVCDNQQLVWSFLAHTGLTLDDQNPPNLSQQGPGWAKTPAGG
jgi:hypothetical protein